MIIDDMFHMKDIKNIDSDGKVNGNRIYQYGDKELNFLIGLVKLQIREEQLFLIYEPMFDSYTGWLKRNKPNIDFYDYLKYTAKHNEDIILKDTIFKFAIEDGTLVDYNNKMVTEVNAILYFNNYEVFIRDAKLWVSSCTDTTKQYYYDLNC